ncbi:TonB family protein [uncultured Microscilla sp.]|uniref:TonB family protein n=1 Tax=uncultured Microscilla sp. TaxID=432653 RepID=UPI002628B49F|nr:TonB family protein [uncultured Microscilla sp.]
MKKALIILILCSVGKLWWNTADADVPSERTMLTQGIPVNLPQNKSLQYFSTDIYHEISYPTQALNHCITGCVKVRFGVYANGAMSKIIVSQGLGYGIDEEVLRAFKNCKRPTLPVLPGDQINHIFEVAIHFTINGMPSSDHVGFLINSRTIRPCLAEENI